MSFAPPHRPLGLIALVLFIDLGLAGAGAFLLAKGLAKPEPEKAAPTTPEKKTEAPSAPSASSASTAVVSAEPIAPPAATPTPTSAPEPTPTPAPAPAAAARNPRASSPPSTTRTAATSSAPSGATTPPSASSGPVTAPSGPVTSPNGGGAEPAQPAATPASTASEIEALAQRSAGGFARCKGDAAVAGYIEIAFNVNPDGSVSNASAVENTTGSAELGNCLTRVIAGWRVSPFQGARRSFMRPFSYQ